MDQSGREKIMTDDVTGEVTSQSEQPMRGLLGASWEFPEAGWQAGDIVYQ